jgi:hypothetical protein
MSTTATGHAIQDDSVHQSSPAELADSRTVHNSNSDVVHRNGLTVYRDMLMVACVQLDRLIVEILCLCMYISLSTELGTLRLGRVPDCADQEFEGS